MRKVRRIRRQGQDVELIAEQLAAVPASAAAIDTKVALIQELIPLGLLHVQESLQQEVERLAGPRYARQGGKPGVVRYGKQPGSIYLADQKLGIEVPRMRNLRRNREVPLRTYQQLQQPRAADHGVLQRILTGLTCREYERCAEAVPRGVRVIVLDGVAPLHPRQRQEAASAPRAVVEGLRLRGRVSRRQDVRGRHDGGGAGRDAHGREGGAGLCGDEHGERQGVYAVPPGAQGAWAARRGRAAGDYRWRQGVARRRGAGLRQRRRDPTLPVAQARERAGVSRGHAASGHPPQTPSRL